MKKFLLSLGLLTLTFTIYMIPGLWGAPLNLISAFPPAQHYSESPYGVGSSQGGTATATTAEIPTSMINKVTLATTKTTPPHPQFVQMTHNQMRSGSCLATESSVVVT